MKQTQEELVTDMRNEQGERNWDKFQVSALNYWMGDSTKYQAREQKRGVGQEIMSSFLDMLNLRDLVGSQV